MPGLLHGEDKPNQLLGSMGDGHIVVLALCPFLGEIGGKGWIPKADIFGGIKKRVAQISGAPFLHVGVTVFQLPGLVSRRRHTSISQQFVWGSEAREIPSFRQDHGAHAVANTGNGCDGRLDLIHHGLNFGFNLVDFSIQFPNEPNGVLQLQRFGPAFWNQWNFVQHPELIMPYLACNGH